MHIGQTVLVKRGKGKPDMPGVVVRTHPAGRVDVFIYHQPGLQGWFVPNAYWYNDPVLLERVRVNPLFEVPGTWSIHPSDTLTMLGRIVSSLLDRVDALERT